MTTTVLLVDDHPVVRSGLRTVLDTDTVHVVGEAATGKKRSSSPVTCAQRSCCATCGWVRESTVSRPLRHYVGSTPRPPSLS